MIKAKTLAILGAAALLAVGAAVFVEKQDADRSSGFESQGKRLLPDLSARLNDVAELQVRSGEQTTTLKRENSRWVIAERSNYPADPAKVRALLLGTASLMIVEPKTTNPELFTQLGLEDPTTAGAQSIQVTIKDDKGSELAAVVFGKERAGRSSLDHSERYVRNANDQQTWLVEGRVTIDKRAPDWMVKTLTNLDNQRIKQVTIQHSGEPAALTVGKESPDDSDLKVLEPETDMPIKAGFEVTSIANTFAHLSFEDVKPMADVDFKTEPLYIATLETFDGLKLTLESARAGEQTFARLRAEGATPAVTTEAPAPATDQNQANAAPSAPQSQGEPDETAKEEAPAIDVVKEAAELNAQFGDWAFQLPSFQVESIGKRLKDLAEEPGAETQPSASTARPAEIEPIAE